jgi:hypothetical protein
MEKNMRAQVEVIFGLMYEIMDALDLSQLIVL